MTRSKTEPSLQTGARNSDALRKTGVEADTSFTSGVRVFKSLRIYNINKMDNENDRPVNLKMNENTSKQIDIPISQIDIPINDIYDQPKV